MIVYITLYLGIYKKYITTITEELDQFEIFKNLLQDNFSDLVFFSAKCYERLSVQIVPFHLHNFNQRC